MKILSYQVHNVLRVSDVDLNMEGRNLVLVGGANGEGKSSALKALLMALCGKSGMDWPDIALKEGEDEGSVTVKLSGDEELQQPDGLTVELTLRRKRGGVVAEEFRVLDSTGEEAPEPRTLLKRLYSMRAFDPLAFERDKPKERAELLRKLVGLDFTELDEERKTVFAQRTVVNTEGKARKAELDGIGEIPAGTPDAPLNASELFAELEDAKKLNAKNDNERRALTTMIEQDRKLAEEEQKLLSRIEEIVVERRTLEAETDRQEHLCEALKDADIESIEDKIKSADTINNAVSNKMKKNALEKLVKELRGKSQKMTDRLKEIDEEKQSRLESAEWPLPGLSLDDAGVLLNGLPFEQASKAQRVLASVKIGMAINPKLRLLVCEDGNDLDNDTLSALEKALDENDFQMLLEFVTRSAEDEARCAVVFHDGAAKPAPEEPVSV